MPDELLAQLDWVVASLHTSLDRSPTERVLAAIENPHVDCIGHLTAAGSRAVREPISISIASSHVRPRRVTALEINSQPDRLDMRDVHARLAGAAGVMIPIDTDAHSIGALAYAELGDRPRPPRVADEGAGAEHALVGRDRDSQSVSTFREDGAAALDWVARYLEDIRDYPVLSQVEPGEIRAALPAAPPEEAEPFAAVLRDLDQILMPGITHWQSPRYFAYFATTAAEPGILAELLIAGLNQVGILWRASPALQELEEVTLDWLRQLLGLPEPLARAHRGHGLVGADHGPHRRARRRPDRKVVVCSEHTHSSTIKAARLLELDVRATPVDAAYALRPDALDLTDACAVVATVGTTSSTAVDPVAAIADRAAAAALAPRRCRLRRAAAVCPELRHHFAGWERADSIGFNPHKWLFTPMDCSAFFCRRPDDLRRAFSLVPEYLRVNEDVVSLSEYASPLGRRFRALKLWATLRCFGREGLQEIIREHVRLAELFEQWVPTSLAGSSARRVLLARLLPQDRRATRRMPRSWSASTTAARSSSRIRARRPLRAAPRDRQRAHERGRRRACVGRAARGCGRRLEPSVRRRAGSARAPG